MAQENVSEYFLNWLISTPDFVFFKDTNGVYREISNSVLDLADVNSKEEVIGKRDIDLYSEEVAKAFIEQDRIVTETKANLFCEDWVIHKTVGKMLIETLKSPAYDKDGNFVGIQGVSRNITGRYNLNKKIQKVESELKAIFKTLPSMVWIKDLEGRYMHANNHYQKYFDIDIKEVNGEKVLDVLHEKNMITPENLVELRELDNEIIKTREMSSIVIPINMDNKERWLEIIKAPIILEDGTISGIFGTCEDITERKNYDVMMKVAKDKAEEASRAKSEFLANISHEIRTPMNGIMGFVQLLESTNLDNEQKDYLKEISSSSKILLSLLNDLLDLAKAESGKLVVENAPFDLYDALDTSVSFAKSSILNKPVIIKCIKDKNVKCNVVGDEVKFKQVLNNLINNAIKFTEKGEIKISAILSSEDAENIEVLFKIEDTGIGIKQEHLSKIFQSFTQADASTTRKYGGSGLGLAIVKNIVEKMGGQVKVESHYGIGSIFSFTMKFKKDLN